MMYRAVIGTGFTITLGVGVGAMISRLSADPALLLGTISLIIAVILGLTWLLWSRLSNPFINNIRKNLEASILSIILDRDRGRAIVKFKIIDAQSQWLMFRGFNSSTIKLDTKDIGTSIILSQPVRLSPPSTEIEASFIVLSTDMEYIDDKKAIRWEIEFKSLLQTRWGETIWDTGIMKFTQNIDR